MEPSNEKKSLLDSAILFCLKNKLVVLLATAACVFWGIAVAPFDWNIDWMPRSPVPVDAIPDIGENQQIVFTAWPGRSPQDIEDQITYPLTVSMLGLPGVKTVRSSSMFGFSSISVIFKENVDFYWSRSRVLEKLNSLPAGTLPPGVKPALGPDATGLGQIYWYTLEGRDPDGKPAGGWDLDELRSIQDWYARYGLLSADGISEVASVGGFVKEYQIDVDPDAMRMYGVSLRNIFNAVRRSNVDVGARTIEVNKVEYVIRGLGFIHSVKDVEEIVVKMKDNVPIYVKNIGAVSLGPALRRGALDKGGAEAVGGVAIVRYGENPLAAIKNLKAKIKEISPGLPLKPVVDYARTSADDVAAFAKKHGFNAYAANGMTLDNAAWMKFLNKTPRAEWPKWITTSKVTIVPFYDRTSLINETLDTLNTALVEEILVTIIVIIVMLMHLRSSMIISATLPLTVLVCFIAMRLFRVDANIVALSGIAIAIGTIVDMGTVICENIITHLGRAPKGANTLDTVYKAVSEVGGAVLTAILTTVVSFLPVFTMVGPEGKLFKPLAFTKTFTLMASVLVALFILPAFAHVLFTWTPFKKAGRLARALRISQWTTGRAGRIVFIVANILAVAVVAVYLTDHWLPLGPSAGFFKNLMAVTLPIGALLGGFLLFQKVYPTLLAFCLKHKALFLTIPLAVVILGPVAWLGFGKVFGWLPGFVKKTPVYTYAASVFPGLGNEFMPSLDEGSFLYMPTTMPHASIGEAMDIMRKQDMAFERIPEIKSAVGKLGRAETALDPAPISMVETVINYKPEFISDKKGRYLLFKCNTEAKDYFRDEVGNPVNALDGEPYFVKGKFARTADGALIPDPDGAPFRLWRPPLDPELNPGRAPWQGIRSPQDIWDEIVKAGNIPGATSAPKLQPIAARIVMLQSGMRAPMGIKIKGPDLETIEKTGLAMEKLLKEVPGVEPNSVFADRIIGKPYLEIEINREKIARYGLLIQDVQDVIEVAVGGKTITRTVEGRERYPVRVRYFRELRDNIESLGDIIIPTPSGQQIPLRELATIRYTPGPQVIKSEDTFLTGYLLFDKKKGIAETDVVENARQFLESKIKSGELVIPAGVSYTFAGNYKNQIRARKTLVVVLPIALFIIFMILYFQFKSFPTTTLVFSGIAVAWSGGFILIWLYGQDWFMNFSIAGVDLRDLFQIHTVNLSVAVWVGFLALFGIATDDGVVIGTYLSDIFRSKKRESVAEIRDAVLEAGKHRIRPALITTATTILALLPVLTSTGRGSDIMIPMAIPSFGGMLIEVMTMLIVPVLYCAIKEFELRRKRK